MDKELPKNIEGFKCELFAGHYVTGGDDDEFSYLVPTFRQTVELTLSHSSFQLLVQNQDEYLKELLTLVGEKFQDIIEDACVVESIKREGGQQEG